VSGVNWPWNTSGLRPCAIEISCGLIRGGETTAWIGTACTASARLAGPSTSCGRRLP